VFVVSSHYVRTLDTLTERVGMARVDMATGASSLLYEEDREYKRGLDETLTTDAQGAVIAYTAEDAQHPAEIWVADSSFEQRRQLTHVNPELDRYRFGASRLIAWRSVDGVPLRGGLLLPSDCQPGRRYPLVVKVYGGLVGSEDVNRFGLYGDGVDNLQVFATRGYAVLVPDIPLGIGTPMADLLKTVMPGVDRVIELRIADPARLGIMGHSFGFHLTDVRPFLQRNEWRNDVVNVDARVFGKIGGLSTARTRPAR
jgi:dipeptidyl aminopeptidase/acylaminoacyl peptidase